MQCLFCITFMSSSRVSFCALSSSSQSWKEAPTPCEDSTFATIFGPCRFLLSSHAAVPRILRSHQRLELEKLGMSFAAALQASGHADTQFLLSHPETRKASRRIHDSICGAIHRLPRERINTYKVAPTVASRLDGAISLPLRSSKLRGDANPLVQGLYERLFDLPLTSKRIRTRLLDLACRNADDMIAGGVLVRLQIARMVTLSSSWLAPKVRGTDHA